MSESVPGGSGDPAHDIRNVDRDRYWEEFATRWRGLLTYRYLGRQHSSLDSGVSVDIMALRHDMRNASGGVMAAPLCIASPECGGFNDDVVVPNPLIASMQILDAAHDVRRVQILPETLHTGRRLGFSRALIVDADDPSRVIALSTGVGLSLGDAPEGYVKIDNPPLDIVDSPDLPPLHEVFGARRTSRDQWELPALTAELASPDAALHIGPQHIVLEAAAEDLARGVNDESLQIEDWYVMFVARGTVGPFRTIGQAFSGTDGRIGVRVDLVDTARANRVVSTAAATFRRCA